MRILGLDPSLSGFGWALLDSEVASGNRNRSPARGKWKSSTKQEFVVRFPELATHVTEVVNHYRPDKVGVESTSFGAPKSESMYALFTHVTLALRQCRVDTVFFAPMQVKAHPRLFLDRPDGWEMQKSDMIAAAKKDTGGGRWNGDSADAYWVAWAAERFWRLQAGDISKDDLTPVELHQFLRTHTYTRGKKKGQTDRDGICFREGERFFCWSRLPDHGKSNIKDYTPKE